MRNQYYHVKIEKIIEHSENLKSFVLDINFSSKPGQFVMVWIPGLDEKPFSLSGKNMITVKKVGPFTEKLFEIKEGYLDIRGPYGNNFPELEGKNIAIGGGCGIAPIYYLFSEKLAENCILAGKTKLELLFLEEMKKTSDIITVTDDGSCGNKGIATDIDIPKSDNYFICGPEIMMKAVAEKLVNDGVNPSNIYLSMERYMKCAVGLCGSCSLSGYMICSDGPIFSYDKIKDLPHFNRFKRKKTGELVND